MQADVLAWHKFHVKSQYNSSGRDLHGNAPNAAQQTPQTSESLSKARLAAEVAERQEKVKRLQRQNAKEAGELLHRDEVTREFAEWAMRIRTRLQSIPDQVTMLVPAELKATVKHAVTERVRVTMKEAFEAKLIGEVLEDLILSESERILERRNRRDTD